MACPPHSCVSLSLAASSRPRAAGMMLFVVLAMLLTTLSAHSSHPRDSTHNAIHMYMTSGKYDEGLYKVLRALLLSPRVDVLVGFFRPQIAVELTALESKHANHLFLLNITTTTWTSGRNRMLDHAIELEQQHGRRYKYFIFYDEDIRLDLRGEASIVTGPNPNITINETLTNCIHAHFLSQHPATALGGAHDGSQAVAVGGNATHSNSGAAPTHAHHSLADLEHMYLSPERRPYTYYECMLLEYEPPFATTRSASWAPKSFFGEPASIVLLTDAASNAFHRNALHILLPYITVMEKKSWWVSQAILELRMRCIYGFSVQFNWLRQNPNVKNVHSTYPRDGDPRDDAAALLDQVLPIELRSESYQKVGTLLPYVVKRPQWQELIPHVCRTHTTMSMEHDGFSGGSISSRLAAKGT